MSIAKRLWHGFTIALRYVGRVQAWIIFTVFYFVLLAPVAILARWFSDPLHLRRGTQPIWTPHAPPSDLLVWAKSQ